MFGDIEHFWKQSEISWKVSFEKYQSTFRNSPKWPPTPLIQYEKYQILEKKIQLFFKKFHFVFKNFQCRRTFLRLSIFDFSKKKIKFGPYFGGEGVLDWLFNEKFLGVRGGGHLGEFRKVLWYFSFWFWNRITQITFLISKRGIIKNCAIQLDHIKTLQGVQKLNQCSGLT